MAGGIEFVAADRSHDAGIRALLRDSPMDGDVRLSLRTEPSYFDAAAIEGEHHAIVAVDRGRVVCVGGVSVRDRYLNGTPARVGYLGRLRLAPSHAGRFDVIRQGYRAFRELHALLGLTACFTSIAADNTRARRLLERGLPGLPRYTHAGDLNTFVLRTSRFANVTGFEPAHARRRTRAERLCVVRGPPDAFRVIESFTSEYGPAFQFAPRWTAADLSTGPAAADVHVLLAGDRPVGCAAVWDQRAVKQTVVCGYSKRLALARPFANALAYAGRGVPLPAAGSTLAQAFASHLALAASGRPEWLTVLLRSLLPAAAERGDTMLAVGMDARDPRSALVRRCFRPFVYRTRLYAVHWPDAPRALVPDGRLLYPEIALL